MRRGRVPEDVVLAIGEEFESTVPAIFGEHLGFAFIFGGFGKGYAGWDHDVDMFVCLDRVDHDYRATFARWYLQLHGRFGLPPDLGYPGELVVAKDLDNRLALLERRNIRPIVESLYEYEAILWADGLIEKKLGFVAGPALTEDQVMRFLDRAYALGRRWRVTMEKLRPEPACELAELDLRRLFKGYVKYLKLPGPP